MSVFSELIYGTKAQLRRIVQRAMLILGPSLVAIGAAVYVAGEETYTMKRKVVIAILIAACLVGVIWILLSWSGCMPRRLFNP